MTVRTKAQLRQEIVNLLTSRQPEDITAAKVRSIATDIVDSYLDEAVDQVARDGVTRAQMAANAAEGDAMAALALAQGAVPESRYNIERTSLEVSIAAKLSRAQAESVVRTEVDDSFILDLFASPRTAADRGKFLAVSPANENQITILPAPTGSGTGGTDDQTAAEVAVDATGFDGNLTTDDDNVQKALQKLDDLDVGGTPDDNSIVPAKAQANSGAEKLAWFDRFGVPVLDFEVDPLYFPQDHVGAWNLVLHLRVHRPEALTGTTHLAVGFQGTNITQAWTPTSDSSLLLTIPSSGVTNLKNTITRGSLTDLDCDLRFGSNADVATSNTNLIRRLVWSLKVLPTDPYRVIAPPITRQAYAAGNTVINDNAEHVLSQINITPRSASTRVDLEAYVETTATAGGGNEQRDLGTELRLYRGDTLVLSRQYRKGNYGRNEQINVSRSIHWIDHPNTTSQVAYTLRAVRQGFATSWTLSKRQMIAKEVLNFVA